MEFEIHYSFNHINPLMVIWRAVRWGYLEDYLLSGSMSTSPLVFQRESSPRIAKKNSQMNYFSDLGEHCIVAYGCLLRISQVWIQSESIYSGDRTYCVELHFLFCLIGHQFHQVINTIILIVQTYSNYFHFWFFRLKTGPLDLWWTATPAVKCWNPS